MRVNLTTLKDNKKKLINKSGIYLISLKNHCLYVGASKDLYERLKRLLNRPCIDSSYILNDGLKLLLNIYNDSELKIKITFCEHSEIQSLERKHFLKHKPLFQKNFIKYGRWLSK